MFDSLYISSECMRHVRRYKYCLKCDCSKFYYSVNHRRIKEIIRKKIKCDRTLRLIDEIIDNIIIDKENIDINGRSTLNTDEAIFWKNSELLFGLSCLKVSC
mgnify:CR=1 FL=1